MKLNASGSRLTISQREWTAIGIRAGWIRQSRKILVEWEGKPGAEPVGISGAVDDCDVAAYLERNWGRKVKGWKPALPSRHAPGRGIPASGLTGDSLQLTA